MLERETMSDQNRLVLAYSGGLDTSVAISYLKERTGKDVVAVSLDVGQGGESLETIKQRALACGAVEAYVVDARDEFANEYCMKALKANALYEGIAVQTVRGLEAVPQFYSDVALTCGATPVWTLWHVKLRVAARQIYGGIRVSAAYIFATASTAEYLGARKGLGIWLQAAYNSFRTPLIFSATIVIILMTCVLMLAVNASERILLGPAGDDEDPDADQ